MMHVQFHHPQVARLQGRLARIPRWAWIAFGIGVLVPMVLLILGFLVLVLTTGAIVMAAVLVVGTILGILYRLLHRKPSDGRKNVQIVVRSARVID